MVNFLNISNATASASSNLTSSDATDTLKQPSPAANKASLLNYNDSNKLNKLTSTQQHMLDILASGENNIQHLALLALQKAYVKQSDH